MGDNLIFDVKLKVVSLDHGGKEYNEIRAMTKRIFFNKYMKIELLLSFNDFVTGWKVVETSEV